MSGLPSPIDRHRICTPAASTRSSSMANAVAVIAAPPLVGPIGHHARCVLAGTAAARATRCPPYGVEVATPPPADTLHHPVGAVRTCHGPGGSVLVSQCPAAPARGTPMIGAHGLGVVTQEDLARTLPKEANIACGTTADAMTNGPSEAMT